MTRFACSLVCCPAQAHVRVVAKAETASSTATLTASGGFSHEMTGSRDSTSDDSLEEPTIEPEGPVNEDLVVRFGRRLRDLKRKRDFEKLQSERTCARCGQCPDRPMVTDCLHLYCNECLETLPYELTGKDLSEAHCVVCDDVIIESQSCQHLKELGVDDFLKFDKDIDHEVGQRYIDLKAEDPEQQSTTITATQKIFLVDAVNRLRKLGYGATYIGITRPINLKTMIANLHAGAYPSIESLKADFKQMKQNSRFWNGADAPHTMDAQNLKAAFEIYMTQYPGPGEDFALRKKAKTKGFKTPPAQTPARAGASSPPRAAKSAMQGRKYPRDHW